MIDEEACDRIPTAGAVRVETVDDLERARQLLPSWADLSFSAAGPRLPPGWLLAWWQSARPAGARLRLLAAMRDRTLVGLAPLFVTPVPGGARYRLLGTGACSPVEPMARPGLELVTARAFAEALEAASPRTGGVVLDRLPASSPWPRMLVASWPGRRPWLDTSPNAGAPLVEIGGRSFEEWLAGRSHHFRSHMRRSRRMLADAGGQLRRSDDDTIDRDMEAFVRLHRARWQRRGGSRVLDGGAEAMLGAARAVDGGAMRLWVAEVAGEVISAHLFLAVAGYVYYWLGGYDDRWARLQPGQIVLLAAVEEACRCGDRVIDLGEGVQPYKLRFCDAVEQRTSFRIVPRSPRLGLPVSPSELLGWVERRQIKPLLDEVRGRMVGTRPRRSLGTPSLAETEEC